MNNVEPTMNTNDQSKGRTILISMLIFFIVPIVVVVMMFKFNWKPDGESAGMLIKPPQQISNSAGLLNGNNESAVGAWKEKWSVVYIAEACEATCYAKLKDMRQLHVSLYKDIIRTQRVLITKSTDLTKIKADFPDILVLNQPSAEVDTLVGQFKFDEFDPAQANRLYFVDPLGFVMMSYQSTVPLANVRKDLKRLLKFSWAG
jgi:hypothetical protein